MTSSKKIDKENVENIFALSSTQEALLYHYIRYSDARSYYVRLFISVKGEMNFDFFKQSWNKIVENNEMLRTVFRWKSIESPIQITLKPSLFHLEFLDLSDHDVSFKTLRSYVDNRFANDDADIAESPFIVRLYGLKEEAFVVEIKTHHILYDGWSNAILLKEFFTTYNSIAEGKPVTFLPKAKFADCVAALKRSDMRPMLAYWQDKIRGTASIASLQDRFEKENGLTPDISRKLLPEGLVASLRKFAADNRFTPATIMYSAWAVLMMKLTNTSNFVLGTTVSGRNLPVKYIENTIGLFINTVPLNVAYEEEDRFLDVVKKVNADLIDREPYVNCSLTELKSLMSLKADDFLFETLVVIENYPFDAQSIGNVGKLKVQGYEISDYNDYGLYLVVNMLSDACELCIYHNPARFSGKLIQKIQSLLQRVIEYAVNRSEVKVSDFQTISRDEKDLILNQFNSTVVEFPGHNTLHELFAAQVHRSPHATAVVLNNMHVSYLELDRRANQLARFIESKGIRGRNVGILMEISVETIVSILGILKSGNAYVPVDPKLPAKRISWIFKDCHLASVLSQTGNIGLLDQLPVENDHIEWIACLNDDVYNAHQAVYYFGVSDIGQMSTAPAEIDVDPDDLAYVIYTSGSTGTPKGVKVRHKGVVNYTKWRISDFGFSSNDNTLQLAPYNFDTYGSNLYSALFSGAALVLASQHEKMDPQSIIRLIKTNSVTNFCITPMLYGAVLDHLERESELSTLRFVVLAGERTSDEVLRKSRVLLPDVLLINEYGPTEASIAATAYKNMNIKTAAIVGKPIANTEIYILGIHGELQPVGVEGQICIGGIGVAAGYVNNDRLTDEKFVPNPFRVGGQMYRTGDLGRWRTDGNVEFFGRMDDQVKIRGFRIELGEIESCLCECSGIKEARVVVAERDNVKVLIAYYIPNEAEGHIIKRVLETNEKLPSSVGLYEFANGVSVYSRNRKEAHVLFQEIFEDNCYLKNGITLPENAVVFDVGANLGMFSIYANLASRNSSIYCFEPIPPIFEMLTLNTSLYSGNFKLLNVGVSNNVGSKAFDYFPHATALSGVSEYMDEVKENVKQYIKNTEGSEAGLSESDISRLLSEKLETQEYTCPVTTISKLIEQFNIERIDLLKLDAENSELDVLVGIEEHDWKKIKQLVIEVHDVDDRLQTIKQLLNKRGYYLVVEQTVDLANTNLYQVFAVSEVGKNAMDAAQASINCFGINKLSDCLRKRLSEFLPDYMLPAYYLPIQYFPLTPNGKIDKKSLPDPEVFGKSQYVAPTSDIERRLVSILADILRLDKDAVSIEKSFFDLGGDSLKAINLVSQIEKKFGTNIRLEYIFESPSIKYISDAISVANLATSEPTEASKMVI